MKTSLPSTSIIARESRHRKHGALCGSHQLHKEYMRVACQDGEFAFIFRDDDHSFRDIPQSAKMLRKCLWHARQSHLNQSKNFIYERVEEFINSLKAVREICIL